MKMNLKTMKCAICQKESEQIVIISNTIIGEPDLDMHPTGSMVTPYAAIQECPFCHYCNYNIEEIIQDKYLKTLNPLEIWNADDGIQNIIDTENEEGPRKYLIMAEQYYQEGNELTAHELLIKAYWSSTIPENRKVYLEKALEIYEYKKLKDDITKYIQLSDLNRQNGDMKKALDFLEAAKSLYKVLPEDTEVETYKFFEKCFDFEKYLISTRDIKPHNLSEY